MKNLAVLLEYLLVVTGLSAIVPFTDFGGITTKFPVALQFIMSFSLLYIYICMVASFDSVFAKSLEAKISVGAFTEIPRKVPAPAHVAT